MHNLDVRPLLITALLATPLFAQAPPRREPAQKPLEQDAAAAVEVTPYKESRMNAIDEELAALLQRRGEAGVDQALLELQIDLRVLARGIAGGLANKPVAKPETAAAYLRLHQVLEAANRVAAEVKSVSAPAQASAMKQLHDMTFRPVDTASVASLDALAKEIATALAAIVPAPSVAMRPAQVEPKKTAVANGDATLPTLASAARKLNVTAGLRRQLITLADTAGAAAASGNAGEARLLTDGLADALDLATGLASNTAVDLAKRQEIEGQLAQGLALYTDVRTREVGRKRLKALAPYRQTIARVGRIRQNPDTARLGKLFIWAQEHGDDGTKVLASVEAYNRAVADFEGREALTALPPNVKRAADAIVRRFQTARATFLEEAVGLPDGGMMAATSKQLDDHVAEMRGALEELVLVESTPRSVDALLAYKPRPIGALEKRVIVAVMGMAGEGKMPQDEAAVFLRSLSQLAGAGRRIGTDLPVAAADIAAWSGRGAAPLQARLTGLLTENASVLASPSGVVDESQLAQLRVAADLCDLLRQAKSIDEAVTKCGPLSRWADWGLDAAQLEAVLKPYRDGTTAAVDGLIAGDADATLQWPRIHAKYGPLATYLQRMSDYGPACAALPDGASASVGKLATAFQGAEFAQVRLAAYVLGIWGSAEQSADLTTANEAAGLLNKQLKVE